MFILIKFKLLNIYWKSVIIIRKLNLNLYQIKVNIKKPVHVLKNETRNNTYNMESILVVKI